MWPWPPRRLNTSYVTLTSKVSRISFNHFCNMLYRTTSTLCVQTCNMCIAPSSIACLINTFHLWLKTKWNANLFTKSLRYGSYCLTLWWNKTLMWVRICFLVNPGMFSRWTKHPGMATFRDKNGLQSPKQTNNILFQIYRQPETTISILLT